MNHDSMFGYLFALIHLFYLLTDCPAFEYLFICMPFNQYFTNNPGFYLLFGILNNSWSFIQRFCLWAAHCPVLEYLFDCMSFIQYFINQALDTIYYTDKLYNFTNHIFSCFRVHKFCIYSMQLIQTKSIPCSVTTIYISGQCSSAAYSTKYSVWKGLHRPWVIQ